MKTVVQTVYHSWEKDQRGGEYAAKRAEVPNVAALPGELSSMHDCFVHSFHGKSIIEPMTGENAVRANRICLRPNEKGLLIEDLGAFSHDGAPRVLARLDSDQWIQVIWNRRVSITSWDECSHWHYESYVLNAGCFSHMEHNSFLIRQPAKVIDLRVDLYRLGYTQSPGEREP